MFTSAAPLLLVGAGGIGNEFLVSLCRSYAGRLAIVDLDTVEASNLHRQVLFSEETIGQSKALVAAQKVEEVSRGRIRARPFTADIKDTGLFPPGFFRQFFCIVSCVDNLEAREHINRVAVILNIAVLESGSTGFLGQAYVMRPKITECFECTGKSEPEEIPLCTIRGAPTDWKHCVHWAESAVNTGMSNAERKGNAGSVVNTGSSKMSLDAVHEAASKRALQFGIPALGKEATRDILSRTVPSIITTNSIIGSVLVIELAGLLRKRNKYVYYLTHADPIRVFQAPAPRSSCSLCSGQTLSVQAGKKQEQTLRDLVEKAGINCPDVIYVVKTPGLLLYDGEEGSISTLNRTLASFSIQTGSILTVHTQAGHTFTLLIEQ